MGNFIKTQSSFADGVVAPEFFGRNNLNGLSRLENMDVTSGGGLTRRDGLMHVDDLIGDSRLVSFSVSEQENYLLVLSAGRISGYLNGSYVFSLVAPWQDSDLSQIQYAQRFDTIIFVHPDYQPRILSKNGDRFKLTLFDFSRNDSDMSVNIPFISFDDAAGISITVTANQTGSNFATFTTSSDFWTPENIGGRLFLLDKQWRVTEYVSPTVVVAYTNGSFSVPSSAVTVWREAAFGTRRGWPRSITFHQNRLVFGGSRSYPAGVWLSRVGMHNNFDVGSGLDDEAIFITLLSDVRQYICTVVSSENLQILTSVGEWAISNKPLTPSAVNIRQHTNVGSFVSHYLPPQKIEGSTIFVSYNGNDIRELTLDEIGENYNATDLCALSKHLLQQPVDITYNKNLRRLYVVLLNGDMAVLNYNSALGISAWGLYKTQGDFKSVTAIGGDTYVVTHRNGTYCLERFSSDTSLDSGKYGFSFRADALPVYASGHTPTRIRVRKISARVLDTKSIFINGSRPILPNKIYSDSNSGFSGDVSIDCLGTIQETIAVPWTISGNESFPATVLSVSIYGRYQI